MAKKRKSDTAKEAAEPAIEVAMEELGTIVSQLESGQSPLEESLQLYERGIKLLRQCHQILDGATSRIEVLTRFDADGDAVTTEFDGSSTFQQKQDSGQSNPGLFE